MEGLLAGFLHLHWIGLVDRDPGFHPEVGLTPRLEVYLTSGEEQRKP